MNISKKTQSKFCKLVVNDVEGFLWLGIAMPGCARVPETRAGEPGSGHAYPVLDGLGCNFGLFQRAGLLFGV